MSEAAKKYIDFTGDDTTALAYIKQRGYASYSSLVNVRDKQDPSRKPTSYFIFGSELHSKFLEDKRKQELTKPEEQKLKNMIASLNANKLVATIMATSGMQTEVEIRMPILDLPMLGYIDIDAPKFLADLKSTHHTKLPDFIESMDFLQPAIYLRMRPNAKHFYYLGISKLRPYRVMTFDAVDYADKLSAADKQLVTLINYVKDKTGLKAGAPKKGVGRNSGY